MHDKIVVVIPGKVTGANGSQVRPVIGVTTKATAPVVPAGAVTVICEVPATFTFVLTGFGLADSDRVGWVT